MRGSFIPDQARKYMQDKKKAKDLQKQKLLKIAVPILCVSIVVVLANWYFDQNSLVDSMTTNPQIENLKLAIIEKEQHDQYKSLSADNFKLKLQTQKWCSNKITELEDKVIRQFQPVISMQGEHQKELDRINEDIDGMLFEQNFDTKYKDLYIFSTYAKGSVILSGKDQTSLPVGAGEKNVKTGFSLFNFSQANDNGVLRKLVDFEGADNTLYFNSKNGFFITIHNDQLHKVSAFEITINKIYDKSCYPDTISLEGLDVQETPEGKRYLPHVIFHKKSFYDENVYHKSIKTADIFSFDCDNLLCKMGFRYYRLRLYNQNPKYICVTKIALWAESRPDRSIGELGKAKGSIDQQKTDNANHQ